MIETTTKGFATANTTLTLLKRPLSPQEEIAVQLLQKILAKKPLTSNEIDQCPQNMRKEIEAIAQTAFRSEEDFWTVFNTHALNNTRLEEYRDLITISPDARLLDPRFRIENGKTLLKLSSIEDIYALPDAKYLILDILESAAVSLLFGISGTGKSFTALDLALCIVNGLCWHGRKVSRGDVWYINTEGGQGLKKRLKAWYIEHKELVPSPNFHIIPWALDIREHYQILLDTLASLPSAPVLIVIDNFSLCAPGVDQNKQDQVAPVLAKINHIAQEFGSHVMIIHHTNKTGDVNGTMAFRNHVDTMIELKKEDQTNKFSPIIFSCQKARDDEPFDDIRTELKSLTVQLEDETLRPITSCVVVDCTQPEPEVETPEDQRRALEILHAHVRLTCTQWKSNCREAHNISRAKFYRIRAKLESDELITTTGQGKGSYYSLTEKGEKTLE